MTRWGLWVQGRLRTRIVLADGGDDPLAELTTRARLPRRPGGGHATDRDGRRWDVAIAGTTVTVTGDGVPWASAVDDVLTIGGRRLSWRPTWDGSRRADVSSDDGRALLAVRPGRGAGEPWATVDVDDELPSAVPVALAACFVVLRADAVIGLIAANGGGGAGAA